MDSVKMCSSLREAIDEFEKYGDMTAVESVARDRNVYVKSYSEFYHDIKCVAAWLIKEGYYESHVAILAKNSYEWLVYQYGGFYAGVEMVLMHFDLPEEKAYENANRADVKLVITDRKLDWDIATKDINAALPNNIECTDLPDADSGRPACLLFTSGTTSIEKMVELSQANMLSFIETRYYALKHPEPIVTFSVFPFSHTGSFTLLVNFFAGNIVAYQIDPKYFFRDIKIIEPHVLMCVPMYVEAITKKIEKGIDIRSILGSRCFQLGAGGATLRAEIADIIAKNHVICSTGYGQTESSGCGSTFVSGMFDKPGSVGKANVEMKVENDEILMRGKCVMIGYYKDEQATKETLKDGWLHTGDLGYIDEDGYVFLTGRKKNLIVLGNGKKVSPEEIENALLLCKSVIEVVVTGSKDYLLATVYANTSAQDEVMAWVKEYNKGTESYKRIQKVEFVDHEFEKTVTGKIKRW